MHRVQQRPRLQWRETVEELGFHFHTLDGEPYWDESAAYEFSANQIDELEQATADLEGLCLEAVQLIIDKNLYHHLQIPDLAIPLIERTWRNDHKRLYGRFDLAYDGVNPPKLLEYNADTPTSLLEASVIQWQWLQEVMPHADQFNSIHERLIGAWKHFAIHNHAIYFACNKNNQEDLGTRTNICKILLCKQGLMQTLLIWNRLVGMATNLLDEENAPILNAI